MRVPLGVIAALLSAWFLTQDTPFQIEVVDGDTVRWMGERVRLLGFDAPEVSRPKCPEERQLAARATARMRELAAKPGAHLVFSGKRDHFCRHLAWLYIRREDAGQIMIREGLAHPYKGRKKMPWCTK